jgi:hypothetical protein
MTRRISSALVVPAVAVALALVASGCGSSSEAAAAKPAVGPPKCPASWLSGWQRLANRIAAPVYCPAWLPDPLTGQITGQVSYGGAGGYVLSVDKDRSYLASFAWQEPQTGEVHVNLRGYPGRTRVPRCVAEDFNKGKLTRTPVPCFADLRGTVTERGIKASVYTVNQDADRWHVLYAWRFRGGLYTVSEHVAVPLTYTQVVANLHRILRNLVLVTPAD